MMMVLFFHLTTPHLNMMMSMMIMMTTTKMMLVMTITATTTMMMLMMMFVGEVLLTYVSLSHVADGLCIRNKIKWHGAVTGPHAHSLVAGLQAGNFAVICAVFGSVHIHGLTRIAAHTVRRGQPRVDHLRWREDTKP